MPAQFLAWVIWCSCCQSLNCGEAVAVAPSASWSVVRWSAVCRAFLTIESLTTVNGRHIIDTPSAGALLRSAEDIYSST